MRSEKSLAIRSLYEEIAKCFLMRLQSQGEYTPLRAWGFMTYSRFISESVLVVFRPGARKGGTILWF